MGRVNLTMKKRANKNTHRFLRSKKNRETTRGKKNCFIPSFLFLFPPPCISHSAFQKNSCCNLTRFFLMKEISSYFQTASTFSFTVMLSYIYHHLFFNSNYHPKHL